MIDDVLDYEGDAAEMGKNLGDDLREGKATLPLILAMQLAPANEAAIVRDAIESGNTRDLDTIVAIVRGCGALERTKAAAAAQAQQAIDAITAFDSNPYTDSLLELAAQLLQRRS